MRKYYLHKLQHICHFKKRNSSKSKFERALNDFIDREFFSKSLASKKAKKENPKLVKDLFLLLSSLFYEDRGLEEDEEYSDVCKKVRKCLKAYSFKLVYEVSRDECFKLITEHMLAVVMKKHDIVLKSVSN
jgi:hypothetical protein